MDVEKRVAELGLEIPGQLGAGGLYTSVVVEGNLAFTSGDAFVPSIVVDAFNRPDNCGSRSSSASMVATSMLSSANAPSESEIPSIVTLVIGFRACPDCAR